MAAGAIVAAIIAVVAGVGLLNGAAEAPAAMPLAAPASAPSSTRPPVVSTTSSSPPKAPAPTTTAALAAVVLPVPDPLPTDAYAPTPEVVLGTIRIPSLGVEAPLGEGMTLTALNRGPSHWPGTALPGQLGNMVIGGHRTTFTKPFEGLDRLQPGDFVEYETAQGTFRYAITGVEIVEPTQLDIADPAPQYLATLFACHPPGSAAYRIVARMTMVDENGTPVPPPAVTVTNLEALTRFRI
ncbi:MAG: class E sortase [Acidimicrobiia bacterium]|nr:class E sortase [Acidimicrobiia bacterium]